MPRHPLLAVARVFLLLSVLAPPARAGRAYVFETDFSTGSFSGVNTATRVPACDVAEVHSDARLRWYDGRVYVINRFGADNIEVLDGTTHALVKQFSVGAGANPYDIAFASGTKAYVTRYESADLWIVNPVTGAHTGTVSLAAYADADGIPEMDHLMMVGPMLFIALQRVDRRNYFLPTDSSLVAVLDTRTDTFVDCDAATPGVQAIKLAYTNPVTPFVFDFYRTRLYIGCAGAYGATDGGIAAVDPADYLSAGGVATEAALGGDVLDLAWADDEHTYAIVSDAAFNTSLIRWSRETGAALGTLYAPGGFTLSDVEVTADSSELWVCNSSFTSPGVRSFRVSDGQAVGNPIVCTLPPQVLCFEVATQQVADAPPPVAGKLELAPPAPNPARGPVRLSLRGGGTATMLRVHDLAGRAVRSLAVAGSGSVLWDLTDDAGRRVPPGLYLVTCRTEQGAATRRVLVTR